MSRRSSISDELSRGPWQCACPVALQSLQRLQKATPAKDSLTRCELEGFLSLARGHRIDFRDHETGESWHGSVDLTFLERGFVWAITDFGERKLVDINLHTVWRPDKQRACKDGN